MSERERERESEREREKERESVCVCARAYMCVYVDVRGGRFLDLVQGLGIRD